jgi:type VI secretion system protein ImpD
LKLCRDLDRAVEFDQSRLFRLVYGDEFDMPGGEPFGLMVGEYEVAHRRTQDCPTDDVAALRAIAAIAAAAFCPFVTSCRPSLLGLDHLLRSRSAARISRRQPAVPTSYVARFEIVGRHSLSRHCSSPRADAGAYRRHDRSRIDGFTFDEEVRASGHELLWANAAFAFAGVVLRAFGRSGWFADLRGAPQDDEGGGLVVDCRHSRSRPIVRGVAVQPSVEIRLTSAQERMLAELGLIPIGVVPYTPYLVFNTNSSLHQPTTYDRPGCGTLTHDCLRCCSTCCAPRASPTM